MKFPWGKKEVKKFQGHIDVKPDVQWWLDYYGIQGDYITRAELDNNHDTEMGKWITEKLLSKEFFLWVFGEQREWRIYFCSFEEYVKQKGKEYGKHNT